MFIDNVLVPTISVPLLGPKRGRGRPRKVKPSFPMGKSRKHKIMKFMIYF